MSAQFLALVVLVKLFSVGQAANWEHIQDSISHEPVQTDGTPKDARLGELTLANFTWIYSSTDSRTSLTVCTGEPLEDPEPIVEQVTLVTTITGDIKSCEGEFDVFRKNCAIFTGDDNCNVDVPSGPVTYKLEVIVTVPILREINKSGTASFTMTVEAATLTCGGTKFIRAKGTNVANIDPCDADGVPGVCYQQGDLTMAPFCFHAGDSVPSTLTLCLMGDNHITQAPDGELTINQLAYAPDESATLFLTHSGSGSTLFEAIVLKDRTPLKSCTVTPVAESSGNCLISGFISDHAEYEVCTIIEKGEIFQTALSSITDLDVQAGADAGSLQFRFTNANPDKMYVAKLDNNPPEVEAPTVDLDCTGVTQDHICYGFLEENPDYHYLTIEYLAAGRATSNKIAIPNLRSPRL